MKRVSSASEFKAKCLGCLDDIEQSGEPNTITRRGRPVAVLGPVKGKPANSLRDKYKGKFKILGDIVNTSIW
jgi:antitoxin (DNA-binding transcriptional repressor) of toxin-antitoxin stability system